MSWRASDGQLLWSRNYGGASLAMFNSLDQTVTNSSLIVGGQTLGPMNNRPLVGSRDCLLMLVDKTAGLPVWTQVFGSTFSDGIRSIVFNSNNSLIYATGHTDGVMGSASAGSTDVFVSRHFVQNGSLLGTSLQFGSAAADIPSSIAISADRSFLYVAGQASDALRAGGTPLVSGSFDQFIAAVNMSALSLGWQTLTGTGSLGDLDMIYGIAIHPLTG
jgi:hypothetical protein